MSNTKRITWIDASKGIGIFLVMIGHSSLIGPSRSQIYAFHMPLFFFLSGYLFSTRKFSTFKDFFISKAKSLLIPYLVFSIISIILYGYFREQPIELNRFLEIILISKRNSMYFNDALWFLPSLFLIEIIFYIIVRFLKNQFAIVFVTLLIGYLSCTIFNPLAGAHILPWSLDQSLFFIVYFGFGYCMKTTGLLERDLKKSIVLCTLAIIYVWLVIDPRYYQKAWEIINLPSSMFIYFNHLIWASLAISFVIYISQFLSISPLINYIGKNSLNLMVLHLSLGFNLFAIYFREGLNIEDHPNILALFYTFGTIIILLPFCYFINKFLPFLHGKKFRFGFNQVFIKKKYELSK